MKNLAIFHFFLPQSQPEAVGHHPPYSRLKGFVPKIRYFTRNYTSALQLLEGLEQYGYATLVLISLESWPAREYSGLEFGMGKGSVGNITYTYTEPPLDVMDGGSLRFVEGGFFFCILQLAFDVPFVSFRFLRSGWNRLNANAFLMKW